MNIPERKKVAKRREKDSPTKCISAFKSAEYLTCVRSGGFNKRNALRTLMIHNVTSQTCTGILSKMWQIPKKQTSCQNYKNYAIQPNISTSKRGQIPYLDSLSSGDVVTRLEQLWVILCKKLKPETEDGVWVNTTAQGSTHCRETLENEKYYFTIM